MSKGLGWLMQLGALILLPVALWYGVTREDIYTELLMGGAAVGLWLVGAQLRGGRRR